MRPSSDWSIQCCFCALYNLRFDLITSELRAMVESAEEYKVRLAAYTEGKNPIAMQGLAPRTLAQLIEGVAEGKLGLRPAPNKWSVTEILAHIAEDELTSTWRYRQMLEHEGPELLGLRSSNVGASRKLWVMEG